MRPPPPQKDRTRATRDQTMFARPIPPKPGIQQRGDRTYSIQNQGKPWPQV